MDINPESCMFVVHGSGIGYVHVMYIVYKDVNVHEDTHMSVMYIVHCILVSMLLYHFSFFTDPI